MSSLHTRSQPHMHSACFWVVKLACIWGPTPTSPLPLCSRAPLSDRKTWTQTHCVHKEKRASMSSFPWKQKVSCLTVCVLSGDLCLPSPLIWRKARLVVHNFLNLVRPAYSVENKFYFFLPQSPTSLKCHDTLRDMSCANVGIQKWLFHGGSVPWVCLVSEKLPCGSMKSRIYMFPYFPILSSPPLSLKFPLWSNVLWCFQTCIPSRRWRLTNIDERDWCWGQRSGEGSLSASPILSHPSIRPFSLCPPDKQWVRLFLIRMDRWSQKSAVKGTVRLRQHRV